ncbi:MAG TPA: dihydrolipoamide acetyltransferase family protein [Pyrinomonadaceae bacterium]|nr:dihydrolipoamide acetyltransferase family protein [Pyrinomonadaceae bacterium]
MSTEVVMPQMGESIAEGTITRWMKQVGERVERDEPLFEISTDKVDAEIPSPAAGTLTEIKFKEGETVEVNKVVAIIGAEGETAATPAKDGYLLDYADAAQSQAPAAQAAVASDAPAAPTAQTPAAPAAQPSAPQQATAAGTSQTQQVAEVAGRSYDDQRPGAKAEGQSLTSAGGAGGANGEAQAVDAATGANGGAQSVEDLRRTKSSPLVRNIAREHNIDITQLEGTGMSGRVTKNDILSFIESGATTADAAAAPPQQEQPAAARAPQQQPAVQTPPAQAPHVQPGVGDRVEPMTLMRKKIAEHMIMSQNTSAHVATVYEIDMTRIAKLRDRHKAEFHARTGTKLTYMPFIFQAITSALRKFPIFNAQVSGDQIIYKQDINLGMAVALDWGLIVPVIKRADDLSISGLARAANDLADRARNKQLKPDEVAGGTFTVTNPGVFGGLFGTPIINQPQVAILGIGTIEKRAKVLTTPEGDDFIAIRHMAYFALSFDHRIIDGADAERFLAYVKQLLEAGQFTV